MNEKHFFRKAKFVQFNYLNRLILFCFACMIYSFQAYAFPDNNSSQEVKQNKVVTGVVVDGMGESIPGANVVVEGTTRGVITDMDGKFKIEVTDKDVLRVSFLGMQTQKVPVAGKSQITVTLIENVDELEEVTIVAFAKQKKNSVVSSISTVKPSELKVPSSNLTSALGGRIAGLVSYQRSGEPGRDNSDFFIRGVTTFGYKKDPLILIDNVELTSEDLARLQVDDIASFSIMKDASATALYGARGANGVILVTTKEGKEGKVQINLRLENSFSGPTSTVDIVDPISYMKYSNEAVMTRDPLNTSGNIYSNEKIDATIRGGNPYVYPAVDWYDELFNDFASNQRANLSLSGGGKVARYYVAGAFSNDKGVLKRESKNNFNNNINLQRIQLRSNVNIKVTETTDLNVRLSGSFEDYKGPIYSGSELFGMAMAANPVSFPKTYPSNDPEFSSTQHPLFGNKSTGLENYHYLNPYAEMVRGHKDYSKSVMIAQLEFKQKLDFVTEGLGFRALGSTTRDAYFDINRQYNPFYYGVSSYDPLTDQFKLFNINPNGGTEFLQIGSSEKLISTAFYFEGAVDYNRTFNEKHAVSGLLVGTARQQLDSYNGGDLQQSLALRNLGLSGRLTYAYDSRYFIEGNFGYNGSERFAKKERFGFFPSVGGGWLVSNEKFWEGKIADKISKLKLKATYGLVGNDAIGEKHDRFFYLSNVDLRNPYNTIRYGTNLTNYAYIMSISRYANDRITWETSKKLNAGIELGILDKIEIQADYFREYRKNILMDRTSIPATMGLQAPLRSNVGEASSHGFEVSVDVNHSFNKDFWLTGRANFTYATNKFEVYDEPNYPYSWLYNKGLKIKQQRGLIAERLFIDEADIANSPRQTFGEYLPGDIKYKDINNDGLIDSQDFVPIGFTETPEIMYGFGLSTGYKNFDFSFFFQGSAQSSFFIDPVAMGPFLQRNIYKNNDPNTNQVIHSGKNNNAMLQAWADSYWSETNRDIYALWPRLSTEVVNNNTQASTWFQRDGSFLRLKSVELGYTLPKKLTEKARISNLRVYASGLNLLLFSKFDLWDVEMGGNGMGYPIQRVYNVGLNVSF